ncbi:MAG: polysaccharide deacetylase family protein [Candidatus Omnitrophota bacterium]|jgi:hypothetical protein
MSRYRISCAALNCGKGIAPLLLYFLISGYVWGQEPSEAPPVLSPSPVRQNDNRSGSQQGFFTYGAGKEEAVTLIPREVLREEIFLKRSQQSGQLTEKAVRLMRQGDLEAGRQVLWDALAYAPNNSRAYSLLAQIYFWWREDAQALSTLEQAGRYQVKGDLVYGFLERALFFFRQNDRNAPVLPPVSVARFKDNKQCAISFNFDDGSKSVYTMVLPVFDKYGYKVTVLVNPGWTTDQPSNPYYGSWEEWKAASERGHEIGNHSMNHRYLMEVPEDVFASEIHESYNLIAEKIGTPPRSFAFPFDQSTPEMVTKVGELHPAIRERGYLSRVNDNIFLPVYGGDKFSASIGRRLIDLVLVKRLWVVAECHAVKTEEVMTFKPITIEFLEDHLSYIKDNEERIWVDTFANTYSYMAERQASRLNILESGDRRIVFVLDHDLDKSVYQMPLTVVVNTAPQNPYSASAQTAGKDMQATLRGTLIILNVLPGPDPVTVRWD